MTENAMGSYYLSICGLLELYRSLVVTGNNFVIVNTLSPISITNHLIFTEKQ